MVSAQISQPQTEWVYETIRINEIINCLSGLGYKCEVRASLRGMSGVLHPFDLVCRGDNTRIAIDFLAVETAKKSELVMVGARAKIYDCSPDLGIMVCLHKMNTNLSELSKFYRFTAIEASTSEEICKKLKELLPDNALLQRD